MVYALVTGASKGIGKAIAFELASRGNNLLLISRSGDVLQELATDIKNKNAVEVFWLQADLSNENGVYEVFGWCNQNNYYVNLLVNNAGYGLSGRFDEMPLPDQLNMMQLNMNCLVQLCYLFLPQLKQQQQSYILNIASSSAYQALPLMAVYAASKAFVLHFSRALNLELKRTPVSVTCISPGSTDTEFVKRASIKEKALKAAKKVNMTPAAVAKIAVDSMYSKKTEVITGFINKAGAFLVWLLPKKLAEKTAMKIYE
jgi:uncharacterized protein